MKLLKIIHVVAGIVVGLYTLFYEITHTCEEIWNAIGRAPALRDGVVTMFTLATAYAIMYCGKVIKDVITNKEGTP